MTRDRSDQSKRSSTGDLVVWTQLAHRKEPIRVQFLLLGEWEPIRMFLLGAANQDVGVLALTVIYRTVSWHVSPSFYNDEGKSFVTKRFGSTCAG